MGKKTYRLERDPAGIFLTRLAEQSLRASEQPRKVENHCLKAAIISRAPAGFSQRGVIAAPNPGLTLTCF